MMKKSKTKIQLNKKKRRKMKEMKNQVNQAIHIQ